MPNRGDTVSKKKFILPFATPSENRLKDFTENMEMATIMCLAESGRDKGGSHVLKRQDEKLVFVAEACYPIWLIPHSGATLIFDGLDLNSTIFPYDVIPDTEVFNIDLRANRKSTEAYVAALARNADYYKDFNGKEEIKIEGFVTAPDLMTDLAVYLTHMKEAKKSLRTKIVLTPSVEKNEIRASISQLSNLKKRTLKDVENLDESTKFLNQTTNQSIKIIRKEIIRIQEKYDEQIAKTKLQSMRKTWQTQSKHNRKITSTSKKFKTRVKRLQKDQFKLRRTLRDLKAEAKKIEKRQSSKKGNKKQRIQSTLRLKKVKKRMLNLQEVVKVNTKKLRTLETVQKLELTKQRTECEKRIKSINGVLQELQASRTVETELKRQEIAQLGDNTRRITNLMQKMVQTKRESLSEFEEITLPGEKIAHGLVYIPFYLVRYEKEAKKRYAVFPPSSIEDMGILTKMRGALGAAKMTALLQYRSKALTAFLNQIVPLIEKDPMLEKVVTEAGIRDSILLKKQLRIGVKRGLKQLEREKWITKDELQTFSKFLYIYA
jgi:DNA repair exonuclease SbcCD ATPase subunit